MNISRLFGATNLDDLGRFIAEQGWVWRLASGRTYPFSTDRQHLRWRSPVYVEVMRPVAAGIADPAAFVPFRSHTSARRE